MNKMRKRLQLSIATLCGALLVGHAAPTAAVSESELLAAARAGGMAASARVFQESTDTTPDYSDRQRPAVSGKAVLIGAAMVSAAIVAAAFILRDRCEPARGLVLDVPRYDPPPGREGVLPAPAPPLPDLPLPDICVPR